MAYTREERETIVRQSDSPDEETTIWTAQQAVIRQLRKKALNNPYITETKTDPHGEWAEFLVQKGKYNVAGGVKRQSNLTPEQREAATERLRKAREGK